MKNTALIGSLLLIGILYLLSSCQSKKVDEAQHSLKLHIEGADLELLSKEPEISTPTGVVVDDENRIWVIENHTHVRQDDYPGPKVDRILIFEGYLDENIPKRVIEYATDFIDGMSLSFTPNGKVLITTRASVTEFTDSDGDLIADSRKVLISLDTKERFPHNGMSGMVIGPDNKIYFQCGENFGAHYEISGTDGTKIIGKEREGGSIFRCDLDGSNLERIATAIWNCFAMTFDDYGNLFAVENDPDSRPPCRMLHIVKGGNYGFQFQHGRDGLSPFTSWFGELPGTLPMVSGVGEAPSGVMHYGLDHLGTTTKDALLVTAWGDNQIEQFQLKKNGSSFTAEMELFVKGGRDFYPVGLATDNNGGIISTDWASVSYAVHGKGRIWRVFNPQKDQIIDGIRYAAVSQTQESYDFLNSSDKRVRVNAANDILANHDSEILEVFNSERLSDKGRMNLIWASHNAHHNSITSILDQAIQSKNELLRAAAVRIMVDHNYKNDASFYLNLINNDSSPFVIREAIYGLASERSFASVIPMFAGKDPFINTAIIETFGNASNLDFLLKSTTSPDGNIRLGSLLTLRRTGVADAQAVIPDFLNDKMEEIRISTLKWIAEDNLKDYREAVEISFSKLENISPRLFDTYMATFQYLDGQFNDDSHFMEGDEHVSRTFYKRQKFLISAADNSNLSYEIRTRCLSAINPVHEAFPTEILISYSSEPNTEFQIEAIRSLSARVGDPEAVSTLMKIAINRKLTEALRLEAIVGLSVLASEHEAARRTLIELVQSNSEEEVIKSEAYRCLESLSGDSEVAQMLEEYKNQRTKEALVTDHSIWRKLGHEEGDALSGARTFFNPRYQCGSCHRINGRGGIFGPDLSQVGSNADRNRIIESLLNPGDIVTPTYAGYAVTTKNDDIVVGRLDKDLDSKRHLQMILADGSRAAIAYDDIADQELLAESLMTPNLHLNMTSNEFRDLIQFLADQK